MACLETKENLTRHFELLSHVAFPAGNRPFSHGLMAGFALNMESIFERRLASIGFILVAGIAGLPLSAPVIQECIKIMMAPSAIQLVFRMELMIELDQRPLVISNLFMIKQERIILGMSRRDETGKKEDNQQKFYVCHGNSLHSYSFSKNLSRRVNPSLLHLRSQQA